MRTAVLISVGIVIVLLAAFFLRATDIIDADSMKADNKKGKKEKKKDKDDAPDNGSQELSGISIVNRTDVPDILKELSALCYIDANRFGTVQDELGSIFIYNTSTKKIEKEIPFAGKGDYEGVAIVKGDAFVLRSDGTIFEVKNYNGNKPAVVEHKTHLTAKHDTEGFCYDSKGNRLLIAIKGDEAGSKSFKGIYAFNLSTRSMPAEPAYKIDLTDKVFANGGKKKDAGMNPSGIAVHPIDGDIYITEGTNPKLLILDQAGNIKSLKNLNSSDFSQPEGITISPDGKIFISNEGTKQAGNILEIEVI